MFFYSLYVVHEFVFVRLYINGIISFSINNSYIYTMKLLLSILIPHLFGYVTPVFRGIPQSCYLPATAFDDGIQHNTLPYPA